MGLELPLLKSRVEREIDASTTSKKQLTMRYPVATATCVMSSRMTSVMRGQSTKKGYLNLNPRLVVVSGRKRSDELSTLQHQH